MPTSESTIFPLSDNAINNQPTSELKPVLEPVSCQKDEPDEYQQQANKISYPDGGAYYPYQLSKENDFMHEGVPLRMVFHTRAFNALLELMGFTTEKKHICEVAFQYADAMIACRSRFYADRTIDGDPKKSMLFGNDGGSAFPQSSLPDQESETLNHPGASIRDYYAGSYLPTLIKQHGLHGGPDEIAEMCYNIADITIEMDNAKHREKIAEEIKRSYKEDPDFDHPAA